LKGKIRSKKKRKRNTNNIENKIRIKKQEDVIICRKTLLYVLLYKIFIFLFSDRKKQCNERKTNVHTQYIKLQTTLVYEEKTSVLHLKSSDLFSYVVTDFNGALSCPVWGIFQNASTCSIVLPFVSGILIQRIIR